MAVTGTKTVRAICTSALRKAQVVGMSETPSGDDMAEAVELLNMMLKAWQMSEYNIWTYTSGSLTLTTALSYTLDPVRPMQIITARLKQGGIELPMQVMTRQEYDNLPQKTSTGLPTQFYYDRQREAAKLYVWPVLATAAGETIEYTYEREFEDVTDPDSVLDVPAEWWEATLYGLGARVAESYMLMAPLSMLAPRAQSTLTAALQFDREGSVFFAGPYADT
tara:strand:+ start:20 stop:685 length:666 start_codon:yes stop_codon:yes gene_type:complete